MEIKSNMAAKITLIVLALVFTSNINCAEKKKDKDKNRIGKNVLDYTDTDIYRLLDQWDENDEDNDPDDYDDTDPRKPPPKQLKLDPTKIKDDPMAFMKMAKKGKTLMVFVEVASKYNKNEAEKLTARWHHSLFNAQFQVQRFMVSDNRAIFMLQDGSVAWDMKDFLIKQPECESVEFDNQKFPGAGAAATPQDQKTEL